MKKQMGYSVLKAYNQWRRGGGKTGNQPPHSPTTIGEALDVAVSVLELSASLNEAKETKVIRKWN